MSGHIVVNAAEVRMTGEAAQEVLCKGDEFLEFEKTLKPAETLKFDAKTVRKEGLNFGPYGTALFMSWLGSADYVLPADTRPGKRTLRALEVDICKPGHTGPVVAAPSKEEEARKALMKIPNSGLDLDRLIIK
jgi:hypothetical protein